ncbi:MAG: 50S ribosomal protein L11 methyltransferase [Victivallaceae bacterium]|nr:50S ribosomal protein L11 methyltransferase [Victivallaceae bacterium]
MNELLYGLKFKDRSASKELVFELLAALELFYSSYDDREGDNSFLMVYAETPEQFAEAKKRFLAAVEDWRKFGLDLFDFEELTIRREEWSEVWKKYFKIIHIAPNLVIRPSWLDYAPNPGEAVVRIDPGMSFGTGQHATTGFCLRKVAEFAGRPGINRLLDAGCGSGILAIAGALLGYAAVDAFDYDPEAVTVAAENIERNGVTGRISLTQADVAAFRPPDGGYDLALVNILSHILIASARHISGFVRPGGMLALAGILTAEFDKLSAAFARCGCVELERFTEREWTSGLFRRRD